MICTRVRSRRSCLALVQGHVDSSRTEPGIEQYQMKGRPMSLMGKAHLVIMWSVDSSEEGEWDRIFASHGEWIIGHPRDGDVALLSYTISKGPERSSLLDPSSEPTG